VTDPGIKVNYSYELPFGPDKPFLKDGVASKVLGGWRIAGVHAYASGYPLTVFPGYGLPLNAGDNPHHRARLRRLARTDAGRRLRPAGRSLAGRLRQRDGAQPERARAVVPERELRAGDDAGERTEADAARIPLRVLRQRGQGATWSDAIY
jgi:hypothetical protein